MDYALAELQREAQGRGWDPNAETLRRWRIVFEALLDNQSIVTVQRFDTRADTNA